MPFTCLRTIAELGPELILAPERHRARMLQAGRAQAGKSIPLSALAVERTDVVDPRAPEAECAVILDTTHVKDGVLDIAAARRSVPSNRSAKRLVRPGDLLVSRLRPYLRQIGFAHPALFAELGDAPLLVSSEFVVLASRGEGDDDLAFLLPLLLGAAAQAMLAAGQEGGHHPRVPRTTLFALTVPKEVVANARPLGRAVRTSLAAFHRASFALDRTLRQA